MNKRIISALILIGLFVISYLIGGFVFLAVNSIVGVIAYTEIISMKKYPKIVTLFGLIAILLLILVNAFAFNLTLGVSYPAILFTIIAMSVPALIFKNYQMSDAMSLIGMILFLGLSFSTFNIYLNTNKINIVYIFLIASLNDTIAYFIGSKFGKKHFTKISPNKTLEGLISGVLCGFIAGTLFMVFEMNTKYNIISILLINLLLSICASVGDLIFSKIKRENNIKDFSNIIPGHGGVLDRFDSALFASLVYLFIVMI